MIVKDTEKAEALSLTEDAVAMIAAYATKVIAGAGHPGHDLESVGHIMTSDPVLDAIRRGYIRNANRGLDAINALIETGKSCIAHYCNSAGIPTEG